MINTYVKKPVKIEAVKVVEFTQEQFEDFKKWMGDALFIDENDHFRVKTLEGHSYPVTLEDYIIKGVDGEFYPCKINIFEKTYESVEA